MALMLALALLHAIRQTDSISLTVRAAPIKEVCAQLAKASHLQLTVRGPLADEPLIVKFNGVPVQTAMAKIAQAVDAEWTKTGDSTYELERTAAVEKQEYAAHIAVRSARIARSVRDSGLKAHLDQTVDMKAMIATLRARKAARELKGSQRYDAVEAADQQLPPHRLLLRLLSVVDPAQLAAIPPFGCEVFSTNPTAIQHGMPPKALDAIALFRSELALMNAAQAKVNDYPERGSVFSPFPVEPKKDWDGKGFVTLKVGRDQFSSDISATMTVFDGGGKVLARLASSPRSSIRVETVALPKDAPISLSPESSLVHGALVEGSQYRHDSGRKPLDKSALPFLLDPVHHDPLSFATTDVLIEAADANGANLVAQPDDFVHFAEFMVKEGKTTCGAFCTALSRNTAFDIKDGWLTVTPVDRFETRLRRLDRSVMAEYMKSRYAAGFATLDSKLMLAVAQPYLDAPSFITYYDMALGPSIRAFEGDRKAFRFYGTLTPEQRSGLLGGGTLSSLHLSEQQRAALDDWVFHSYTEEMFLLEQGPKGSYLLYSSNSIAVEPTLAVGEGVMRPFHITATATRSATAACYDPNGAYVMDAETLARNMIRNDYPDEGEPPYQPPIGYREGQNTVIDLQVQFDPNHVVTARLNSFELDIAKPMVGLDGLSSAFRSRYDKTLASERALRQKGGAKPAGVTSPPPPR